MWERKRSGDLFKKKKKKRRENEGERENKVEMDYLKKITRCLLQKVRRIQ